MMKGSELLDAAARIGAIAAPHAERHDREGTFVEEGWEALRSACWFAAPVPHELGGGDATTAEVCAGQRALAHHCASTALASSMPMHLALAAAWRWRHGDAVVEPMLRKVAAGTVVASTGGGDFTRPQAVAIPVDGGWRVSGRKRFVSGSPGADAAAGWATIEGTDEAIAFGVALDADGVRLDPTWDAHGMRGTGSDDLVLDDVFVAESTVTGRRTIDCIVPGLVVVAAHALPVILSVYVGVAESMVERAAKMLARSRRSDDVGARRSIGLAVQHVRAAAWTLEGLLDDVGDDPAPTGDTFVAVMLAKREIAERTLAAGDAAMAAVGSAAYYRAAELERSLRDLRAGPLHPIDGEDALTTAAALTLGEEIVAP